MDAAAAQLGVDDRHQRGIGLDGPQRHQAPAAQRVGHLKILGQHVGELLGGRERVQLDVVVAGPALGRLLSGRRPPPGQLHSHGARDVRGLGTDDLQLHRTAPVQTERLLAQPEIVEDGGQLRQRRLPLRLLVDPHEQHARAVGARQPLVGHDAQRRRGHANEADAPVVVDGVPGEGEAGERGVAHAPPVLGILGVRPAEGEYRHDDDRMVVLRDGRRQRLVGVMLGRPRDAAARRIRAGLFALMLIDGGERVLPEAGHDVLGRLDDAGRPVGGLGARAAVRQLLDDERADRQQQQRDQPGGAAPLVPVVGHARWCGGGPGAVNVRFVNRMYVFAFGRFAWSAR